MKKLPKQKKRRIDEKDICRLKVPISAAISPNEKKVAYTVESVSKDKKKYYSQIFVADITSGQIRQFTFGKINDRELAWSPDGKQLAFISTRDRKTGIYVIPAEGGAERKIIEEDGAFTGLKWTPDGSEIVYTFRRNDSFWKKMKRKRKSRRCIAISTVYSTASTAPAFYLKTDFIFGKCLSKAVGPNS